MPTIVLRTIIDAPADICFDLIRHPGLHTGPAFVADGEFGPRQRVTFEERHFGMRQTMTLEVVRYERPLVFIDEMLTGRFRRFRHEHRFEPEGDGTLLTDTLDWISLHGLAGTIVDKLHLERHLRKLVTTRNLRLKELAEAASK